MTSDSHPEEWFLFEMEVAAVLNFIERSTNCSFDPGLTGLRETNKWHMALRNGLRHHLHLNVGIPGVELPDHPVEENESALFAALLLGIPRIKVILSGEWEVAVHEGLISRQQLEMHEAALINHEILEIN